ncbi:MAG: hypothetical protein LBR72_02175 [Oscillospiraceae bacterium]|jgi:hypothetical protein|nr:hypothetical protein [Oscillospiraceae bacterium]
MRHIIICGPSRAGKTTLARRIGEELGHFVIHIDKLVTVFQRAYPRLDIRLNWDRDKTTENLAPFLGHFLGLFHADSRPFVLEGGYFDFDRLAPFLKRYGMPEARDSFILIGLAQNHKTPDEFVRDFRKYDTPGDWTYPLSDEDLREVAEDAVPYSRSMTGHMLKHGFTVYDTSNERERVFQEILADLKGGRV